MIINEDNNFKLEINKDSMEFYTIRSTYTEDEVSEVDSVVLSKVDLLKLKAWIDANLTDE